MGKFCGMGMNLWRRGRDGEKSTRTHGDSVNDSEQQTKHAQQSCHAAPCRQSTRFIGNTQSTMRYEFLTGTRN